MRRACALLIVLAVVSSSVDINAECVAEPRKPVEVSGQLCGEVFNSLGELVPNTSLHIYNVAHEIVAGARDDSRGRFVFKDLLSGSYSLQGGGDGWYIQWGRIDIVSKRTPGTCTRPIVVYLGLTYPDCSGGWVSEKWDRRHFSYGPVRTPRP